MRWRGFTAQVAVIAVAAGIAQTGVGHALLRRAGLFEEPSGYTSLAFLHPQLLPEQLDPKRANVGVSFVIHDIGNAPSDYRWSVLLVDEGRTHRVDTGEVRVASGRGIVISRSVDISCTPGRTRIVVSLRRPAESIDAWTACRSPRS